MFRKVGQQIFGGKSYQAMSSLHSPCKTSKEPTFWEFVQFVVKYPGVDGHWKPYSQSCAVCAVRYRYVIKFERLEEEERELLGILGLAERFPPMFLKRMSGRENVTERYLEMLRREDCMKLMKIYKQDIQIFGYKEEIVTAMQRIWN